jgi:hypothetical protein
MNNFLGENFMAWQCIFLNFYKREGHLIKLEAIGLLGSCEVES